MMNKVIAKELMNQIEGLVIESWEEGWDWTYRKGSSNTFFDSPLDAFIDFTKTILEANDKLTGFLSSYNED